MLSQKNFATLVAMALLSVCISIPATAQLAFNDFSSTAGLTLKGTAVQATNGNKQVLRLTTDGQQHVSGAAWGTSQQSVGAVLQPHSHFRFRILQPPVPGRRMAWRSSYRIRKTKRRAV
jgi:hypothetical protein